MRSRLMITCEQLRQQHRQDDCCGTWRSARLRTSTGSSTTCTSTGSTRNATCCSFFRCAPSAVSVKIIVQGAMLQSGDLLKSSSSVISGNSVSRSLHRITGGRAERSGSSHWSTASSSACPGARSNCLHQECVRGRAYPRQSHPHDHKPVATSPVLG